MLKPQHRTHKPLKLAKKHKLNRVQHGMITRQKSTLNLIASQNAVLNTTELLEHIMHYLPVQNLAQARCVCPGWQSVVDKSLKLQQCLFRWPVKTAQTWIHDQSTGSLRAFTRGTGRGNEREWVERQRQCVPTVINPVLMQRDPDAAAGLISIRERFERAETLTMRKMPDVTGSPKPASYDSMLICQPPAIQVKIEVACNYPKLLQDYGDASKENQWVRVDKVTGVTWKDVQTGIREKLSDAGKDLADDGIFKLDIQKTKVWAVGVVAYTRQEAIDIDSGRERAPDEAAVEIPWRVV